MSFTTISVTLVTTSAPTIVSKHKSVESVTHPSTTSHTITPTITGPPPVESTSLKKSIRLPVHTSRLGGGVIHPLGGPGPIAAKGKPISLDDPVSEVAAPTPVIWSDSVEPARVGQVYGPNPTPWCCRPGCLVCSGYTCWAGHCPINVCIFMPDLIINELYLDSRSVLLIGVQKRLVC